MRSYIIASMIAAMFVFWCVILIDDRNERKINNQRSPSEEEDSEESLPSMFIDNTGELLDLEEMEF